MRRARPAVQMFVLGVIGQGPTTGYELRQTALLWEVADWAGFGVGSIYNAVARLTDEGLIQQTGQERHGGYGPRRSTPSPIPADRRCSRWCGTRCRGSKTRSALTWRSPSSPASRHRRDESF